MSIQVYVAFDADHVGRVIGDARLRDDPDLLRKVSSKIDAGNELFKTWATNQGGSSISAGGDEGILVVPATALADLPKIKEQYETLLELTVSIGLGVSMSQAFKALMAAKLRGRNKTIFYDTSVEDEIKEAIKDDSKNDAKKKIVDEYLSKSEESLKLAKAHTIHHVGNGGPQNDVKGAAESNPEVQQQQDIAGMPDIQAPNFEVEFRTIADAAEKSDLADKTQKSSDFKALKAKVSDALLAIHQQMPQLAQIKQAAPDTYAAILGVVKGVIALGQEIQNSEQKMMKSMDFITNPNEPPKPMLGVGSGLGALDKMDLVPGGMADKFQPSHFDQEQLAIGTMRELEHTDDEDLAREIAMDHLVEDPDYYKIEEEPLEKMALMHDDEKNPVVIYRVQNNKGEGPYHNDFNMNMLVGLKDLSHRRTPTPREDFVDKDVNSTHNPNTGDPQRSIRFGFHTPENAEKWFGKRVLGRLAEWGFKVTPVKAKKVWISKSKRQVMFLPHESEKKLLIAKSDWPMNEKEELDPSEAPPADNVLDKRAVPEHVKSMNAKGQLIPGTALDSRHLVVRNAQGKNVIRQVAAGMQRTMDDTNVNPIGPGLGGVTSTRNKPSKI